jgi:hypothetical protein
VDIEFVWFVAGDIRIVPPPPLKLRDDRQRQMPDVTPGARDGSYKKLTGLEGKRKEPEQVLP